MTRKTQKELISNVLFAALELSKTTWVVACSDHNGTAVIIHRVSAGDLDSLTRIFDRMKKRFGLAANAEVRTVYEAGRDGFHPHRLLTARGVTSLIVNPASIEVPRGQRQNKTDRIDARKLLEVLLRLALGHSVAKLVTPPTPEQEDQRQLPRERESIQKAITSVSNRVSSLLFAQGVNVEGRNLSVAELDALRLWNGEAIPGLLHHRIARAIESRDLLKKQLREVTKTMREDLRSVDEMARKLHRLKGIGLTSAIVIAREMFWRNFATRRQVGGYTGLTSVPRQSGATNRDLGISRTGNARVRKILVEDAWLWIRHQRDSELSKWFFAKFRGKTMVGIVALARRLAVAMWRWLKFDEVPEGAVMRTN
jgi:transposase